MKELLLVFTLLLSSLCCKGQEQSIELDSAFAARLYADSLVAFDSVHSYTHTTHSYTHSLIIHKVKDPKLYWERRQKIIRSVNAATILDPPYLGEHNNEDLYFFVTKLNWKFYDYSDDNIYKPILEELQDACRR